MSRLQACHSIGACHRIGGAVCHLAILDCRRFHSFTGASYPTSSLIMQMLQAWSFDHVRLNEIS